MVQPSPSGSNVTTIRSCSCENYRMAKVSYTFLCLSVSMKRLMSMTRELE